VFRDEKLANTRDQSFDVNILPTLDILSVLICFLLLTAIWVQMGYVPTKQIIEYSATNPSAESTKGLELHITWEGRAIEFKVAGGSKPYRHRAHEAAAIAELAPIIRRISLTYPDLKLARIYPSSNTEYGRVVALMNELRKNKITDLGLVPSGS
jgi:biopolymer transport protein ExbD